MKKINFTKIQAIEELIQYDHSFLTPECVKTIVKPFGLKAPLYWVTDTRSQFKGLTLYGINPETEKEYKEGDKSEGQDADRLACYIANNLKIKYPDKFGRGSQLRAACEAILKHLRNEK